MVLGTIHGEDGAASKVWVFFGQHQYHLCYEELEYFCVSGCVGACGIVVTAVVDGRQHRHRQRQPLAFELVALSFPQPPSVGIAGVLY